MPGIEKQVTPPADSNSSTRENYHRGHKLINFRLLVINFLIEFSGANFEEFAATRRQLAQRVQGLGFASR